MHAPIDLHRPRGGWLVLIALLGVLLLPKPSEGLRCAVLGESTMDEHLEASHGHSSVLRTELCAKGEFCARYTFWGHEVAGCFSRTLSTGVDACASFKALTNGEACCCETDMCNENEGCVVASSAIKRRRAQADPPSNDPPTPYPTLAPQLRCNIVSSPEYSGPLVTGVCDLGSNAGWGFRNGDAVAAVVGCTTVGKHAPYNSQGLPADALWCASNLGLNNEDVYDVNAVERQSFWGLCACDGPTQSPVDLPTPMPTAFPTTLPTGVPSSTPSRAPITSVPSGAPRTSLPSRSPSRTPSRSPSTSPRTSNPSRTPSRSPSKSPSRTPSTSPTPPTVPTTLSPSEPTLAPSRTPSKSPSRAPSGAPLTRVPSRSPNSPTTPTVPTSVPSGAPSTQVPSKSPTTPTAPTTLAPGATSAPSQTPSLSPRTSVPSRTPSVSPTTQPPSKSPSLSPTPFTCRIVDEGGPLTSGACNFGRFGNGWTFEDQIIGIRAEGLGGCVGVNDYVPAGGSILSGSGKMWCPGPLGLDTLDVYNRQSTARNMQWGVCECSTPTQAPTPFVSQSPTTFVPVSNNLDLYLHLDQSRSIKLANDKCKAESGRNCWQNAVDFVLNLVTYLTAAIGEYRPDPDPSQPDPGLRVWISTFTCTNGKPITRIVTQLTGAPEEIAASIARLRNMRPDLGTCPSAGMNRIANSLVASVTLKRPTRAMMLVTDGRVDTSDQSATVKAAERIIREAPLYAVGVGGNIDELNLKTITGDASGGHIISIQDFPTLGSKKTSTMIANQMIIAPGGVIWTEPPVPGVIVGGGGILTLPPVDSRTPPPTTAEYELEDPPNSDPDAYKDGDPLVSVPPTVPRKKERKRPKTVAQEDEAAKAIKSAEATSLAIKIGVGCVMGIVGLVALVAYARRRHAEAQEDAAARARLEGALAYDPKMMLTDEEMTAPSSPGYYLRAVRRRRSGSAGVNESDALIAMAGNGMPEPPATLGTAADKGGGGRPHPMLHSVDESSR